MNLLHRVGNLARAAVRESSALFSPADPVYVFHHIPKCGGTSLNEVLDEWFVTRKDYRVGWSTTYPDPVDLGKLRSCHCLCGHFEVEGYFLHQRYPEVLTSPRYRLFTWVRDPLAVQLSLFRYEKAHDQLKAPTLEEHLRFRTNYVAERFQATDENYREVIDRYFFVGLLEEAQLSLDVLAALVHRPFRRLPWVNVSSGTRKERGDELSERALAEFRERNALDYRIYEYCGERFRAAVEAHRARTSGGDGQ